MYGPPFNHEQPPPGARPSPDLCEYPDILKELVFIIYQNKSLREKVFTKLGVTQPASLHTFQRFVGKKQGDGILGAYEVLNGYLELRDSGEL
jgi:hypothetical protein